MESLVKNYKEQTEKIEQAKETVEKCKLQFKEAEVKLMKALFLKNKEKEFLKRGSNLIWFKKENCLIEAVLNEKKQIVHLTVITDELIII
jgi:hypothetical protein